MVLSTMPLARGLVSLVRVSRRVEWDVSLCVSVGNVVRNTLPLRSRAWWRDVFQNKGRGGPPVPFPARGKGRRHFSDLYPTLQGLKVTRLEDSDKWGTQPTPPPHEWGGREGVNLNITANKRFGLKKRHVSFASPSAISNSLNSLFRVLSNFPSRYLFALGLSPRIFSLGWNLPPVLRLRYQATRLVERGNNRPPVVKKDSTKFPQKRRETSNNQTGF